MIRPAPKRADTRKKDVEARLDKGSLSFYPPIQENATKDRKPKSRQFDVESGEKWKWKNKEKRTKVFEENDIIIYFGKITLGVAWRET